jgi:hypothetical protein
VAVRNREGAENRGVSLEVFIERATEEARTKALDSSRFGD